MKTVRWIRAPVDKVEDNRRWSTQRAELAPGASFSWATCDETKVAALPRSRGQDDGRGWRRPEGGIGKSAMRGQFLFCCSLQPSFQQSFERDGQTKAKRSKVLNSHVALKLKCSGPKGRAVGHVKFQRPRVNIADGQTLTTGQSYYIIINAPGGLS